MLAVARRFAAAYMPYQVGRLPGWARVAIRRTCTPAFARYLLSRPAEPSPLLSAHPTDAETYQVASVNLAAGSNRVSVSYSQSRIGRTPARSCLRSPSAMAAGWSLGWRRDSLVRRLWLFVLALTILLPLLAVMLALSAVSASQAQCGGPLLAGGGPVGGVPAANIPIFQGAAAQFALGDRGPSVLGAINYVESTFGTSTLPGVYSGANSAGAAGPMQIGIGGTAGDTWDRVKVNAPGDPPGQPPDVYDEADAVYSAAHYLQVSGAPGDWPGAIFTYNHSSAYVQQILSLAAGYYTQGLSAARARQLADNDDSGAVTTGSPLPCRRRAVTRPVRSRSPRDSRRSSPRRSSPTGPARGAMI